MKLYHYTSIENLALILKHRTIRFNRLDRMDDPLEKTFLINQVDWSPYTYVSCWTEDSSESIPLWRFYADGGRGVRIGIDSGFIDWDKQSIAFSAPSRQRLHKGGGKDFSGALSVRFNPIRIYRPLSDEHCFCKVEYADDRDYFEFEKNIGRVSKLMEIDEEMMRRYVGRFRKDKWAFQKESRFIIYAVPYTSTDAVVSHQDFINLIRLGMHNDIPYIDVPIKADHLRRIEVTLGPEVTEGQAIIAKAILNKYAPDSSMEFSSLSDSPVLYIL